MLEVEDSRTIEEIDIQTLQVKTHTKHTTIKIMQFKASSIIYMQYLTFFQVH